MFKRSLCSLLLILSSICFFPLASSADDSEAAPQSIVIGIFPRRDPQLTIHLFTPLAEYLQEQLGRKVQLETAPGFEAFWQRLTEQRYDLVHFNQYHYIMAHRDHGFEAVAQNEEFGEPTIRGAIYVRSDSGINSLSQLRGKKLVFGGGKAAMMSYLVPRYLLLQAGLKQGDYQEVFASSPLNAVLATYLKHADAGGAGEVVQRLPAIREKIDTRMLKLIAQSEALAHLPWAVKRDMESEQVASLKQALFSLSNSAQGQAILQSARLTGFNTAKDSDYDIHRQIVARIQHDRAGNE